MPNEARTNRARATGKVKIGSSKMADFVHPSHGSKQLVCTYKPGDDLGAREVQNKTPLNRTRRLQIGPDGNFNNRKKKDKRKKPLTYH